MIKSMSKTPSLPPVQRAKRSHRQTVLRAAAVVVCVLGMALANHAEHTRRWRQSTYEEFLKGTAKGIALRSDGHLELAPKFNLVSDADASYLWSVSYTHLTLPTILLV